MRPIASICCSPPESFVPWLARRSFRLGKSSNTCSTVRPPARTTGGSKRFSWTFRLAKMPRSSGQNATPSRAIRDDVRAIVSAPSNRTEPLRRATIPMIDFSVVVLPAPLRPSSVTTSPRGTSNSTPWRMCDSPYQAFKPRIESRGALGMLGTQVGLDHLRMSGHRPVVALGDDLAAREHRNVIREVLHDAEVVLDHEHGAVGGDASNERRDALHVRVRHAGRGLVEEHHFRIER